MSDEDDGREDEGVGRAAESSGSGLDEAGRSGTGTGDQLARDVGNNSTGSVSRPASEADLERTTLSAPSRDGSAHRARPPGSALSQASSRTRRDKKKKGKGGGFHDGEPAMSVEDLFVTISTVQVWVHVACHEVTAGSCAV